MENIENNFTGDPLGVAQKGEPARGEILGYVRRVKGFAPYHNYKKHGYYVHKENPFNRATRARAEWKEVYNFWEDKYEIQQVNLCYEPREPKEKIILSAEQIREKSWYNTKHYILDLLRENYEDTDRFITGTIAANIPDKIFLKLVQKFGAEIKKMGGGLIIMYERQRRGTLHFHGLVRCNSIIKENNFFLVQKGIKHYNKNRKQYKVSKQEAAEYQESKGEKGVYLWGDNDREAGKILRDIWRSIIMKMNLHDNNKMGTINIKTMITNNGKEAICKYITKYMAKDKEGLNKNNEWGNKFKYFRTKDFFREPTIDYNPIYDKEYIEVRKCTYGNMAIKRDDLLAKTWFEDWNFLKHIVHFIDTKNGDFKPKTQETENETGITYSYKQVKPPTAAVSKGMNIFYELNRSEREEILAAYTQERIDKAIKAKQETAPTQSPSP